MALDPVDDDPSPIPLPGDQQPSLAPERMDDLVVPTLYVASELGPDGQKACAPRESNACRFLESMPSSTPFWLGVIANFGHTQFVDDYDCPLVCDTCPRGPEPEHATRQSVFRGLAVAFLEHTLRGEHAYLDVLEGNGRAQLEVDGMLLDLADQQQFCAPP